MNGTELRRKWIEALRSGEYKQTRGYLCKDLPTGKEYCCLGVLCEVAIKEGLPIKQGISSATDWETKLVTFDDSRAYLPYSVSDTMVLREGEDDAVMKMNDREGKSFSQIADYLESSQEVQ